MQPALPLWLQRLAPDVRRRVELAQATATQARIDSHAQQALNLVTVLSKRVAFDAAIDRYTDLMELDPDDAADVHNRALVMLSEIGGEEIVRRRTPEAGWGLNWRHATPLGAFRFVRRHMRRNAEEDLWLELSAARAEEALVRVHIRHAMIIIDILREHSPPPRSVALYIEMLRIPPIRGRGVYQRVLARIAEEELPRFDIRQQPDAGAGPAEYQRGTAT